MNIVFNINYYVVVTTNDNWHIMNILFKYNGWLIILIIILSDKIDEKMFLFL